MKLKYNPELQEQNLTTTARPINSIIIAVFDYSFNIVSVALLTDQWKCFI